MRLSFHGFTFDSEARLLFRDGRLIHLTPKAFDLLGVLLDRRPTAVAKQTLIECLWPDTSVSEGNLATLISEVRGALRPANEPLIRTVHRFGYAFSGSAIVVGGGSPRPGMPSGLRLVSSFGNFVLVEGENFIGREAYGAVLIDSDTVSRRHARVIVRGRDAVIEDLASKNGTFVGERQIRGPVPIRDGDEIRVGSIKLTLRAWLGLDTATFT